MQQKHVGCPTILQFEPCKRHRNPYILPILFVPFILYLFNSKLNYIKLFLLCSIFVYYIYVHFYLWLVQGPLWSIVVQRQYVMVERTTHIFWVEISTSASDCQPSHISSFLSLDPDRERSCGPGDSCESTMVCWTTRPRIFLDHVSYHCHSQLLTCQCSHDDYMFIYITCYYIIEWSVVSYTWMTLCSSA